MMITMTPDVCGGRPCIRGLRIRVKDVLDLLAAGAERKATNTDWQSNDLAYLQPLSEFYFCIAGCRACTRPKETGTAVEKLGIGD